MLAIQLNDATPVGGWSVRFDLMKRFGGNPFVSKYAASGYGGGASGITIVDSGIGVFRIPINAVDTSGLDATNLAFQLGRTDSGFVTALSQGYINLGV